MAKNYGRRKVAKKDVELLHRRRHAFHGLISGNHEATDYLVGAAAGLVGSIGIKFAVGKWAPTQLPDIVTKVLPALSGIATGGLLFIAQKEHNKSRATAHLLGASFSGITLNVWDQLKANYPSLGDLVNVRVDGSPNGYAGMLVNDNSSRGGLAGMLVNDNSSSGNLADLQTINMAGAYDEDGVLDDY